VLIGCFDEIPNQWVYQQINLFIMISLFFIVLLMVVDSNTGPASNESTFENINAEHYTQIAIGDQVWMAKNLNVEVFRNGDLIPEAKTNEEWLKAVEGKYPVWCYYENNSANAANCGKLYNWYAVNDPRGLAPRGWHIPSDAEWLELSNFLGGNDSVSIKMKSTNGWTDNGNGTNKSGFDGYPAGFRDDYKAAFYGLNSGAFWWSSTMENTEKAWTRSLGWYTAPLGRSGYKIGGGMSVRCVKD